MRDPEQSRAMGRFLPDWFGFSSSISFLPQPPFCATCLFTLKRFEFSDTTSSVPSKQKFYLDSFLATKIENEEIIEQREHLKLRIIESFVDRVLHVEKGEEDKCMTISRYLLSLSDLCQGTPLITSRTIKYSLVMCCYYYYNLTDSFSLLAENKLVKRCGFWPPYLLFNC